MDISFRPVLSNIVSTVSSSLINKSLFEKYKEIQYLFSLIYFNNNQQLQHVLSRILKEEADDFNYEQGIDTSFLVIHELPDLLSQAIIKQQPFLYRGFQKGTLHYVSSDNYALSMVLGPNVKDGE
jgi:hypothetical protein